MNGNWKMPIPPISRNLVVFFRQRQRESSTLSRYPGDLKQKLNPFPTGNSALFARKYMYIKFLLISSVCTKIRRRLVFLHGIIYAQAIVNPVIAKNLNLCVQHNEHAENVTCDLNMVNIFTREGMQPATI